MTETLQIKEGDVVFVPKGDSPSELASDTGVGTVVYIINSTAWVLKDNGYLYVGPLYNLSIYTE